MPHWRVTQQEQQQRFPTCATSRSLSLDHSQQLANGFTNAHEGDNAPGLLQAQARSAFAQTVSNCLPAFGKAIATSTCIGFWLIPRTFAPPTNWKSQHPSLSVKDWNSTGSVFVGAEIFLSILRAAAGCFGISAVHVGAT